MHLFAVLILALATIVLGNTITFKTHDTIPRKVIFYPGWDEVNHRYRESIPDLHLNGPPSSYEWGFPRGWSGMFKAIRENEPRNKNDVIQGEVTFQGFNGNTFFDVSAIHNCCNNDGIHYLNPKNSGGMASGCVRFPCNNVYLFPKDDTKVRDTRSEDLVCGVGFM